MFLFFSVSEIKRFNRSGGFFNQSMSVFLYYIFRPKQDKLNCILMNGKDRVSFILIFNAFALVLP